MPPNYCLGPKVTAWRKHLLAEIPDSVGRPMAKTTRDPDVIHTARIGNSQRWRKVNVRPCVPISPHRKKRRSVYSCFPLFNL